MSPCPRYPHTKLYSGGSRTKSEVESLRPLKIWTLRRHRLFRARRRKAADAPISSRMVRYSAVQRPC
jgi:hypothetical protein